MSVILAASTIRGAGHALALSAAKRFGRYTPEAEGRLRELQKAGTPVLDALHAAWRECAGRDGTGDERYFWTTEAIRYAFYSPADVEAFSIAMSGFPDGSGFPAMAGYFLSALVNGGPPGAYTLHATSAGRMIDHLGYWNSKDLLVKGPAGLSAGEEMLAGTLTIEGNAEHYLGLDAGGGMIHVEGSAGHYAGRKLKGAEILIEGDAGNGLGAFMSRGRITVLGRAGKEAGRCMRGGRIDLEGDYESMSRHVIGGEIYHRGARIR
ncbi:MAG: hypothetical protein AB1529_07845 [Candidatus Micrarchaeota archaeon]